MKQFTCEKLKRFKIIFENYTQFNEYGKRIRNTNQNDDSK